jgi:23S rRNA (uracil1939-C5)-methyltransferase
MSETVEITRLGHAGDGVTSDGAFVPYTVPGDIVRVSRNGARIQIEEVLEGGPWRSPPVCRHFGSCGGCALQHLLPEPYLAWKRELVLSALAQRGFKDAAVEPIRAVPPGTRRRAMFKARKSQAGTELGFYEPESRTLVDILQCPVLVPALEKLIAPLKRHLAPLLRQNETVELHATATDSGVDLSLKWKRERNPELLTALSQFAAVLRLGRLSSDGEPVAIGQTPVQQVGRFTVALAPEAFLQPTAEGERILQTLLRAEIGGAHKIADLFSGWGAFALALAEGRAVHAVDSAGAQIEALKLAARAGQTRLTAETRDLYRRPLLPAELCGFDAVVLDPPRPGAKAQAEALARSDVARVLYVSCNPATFARDARILADGGYQLGRVVPLDQFLWSPHVELFAVFARGR